MKAFVLATLATLSIGLTAQAQDCLSADGLIVPNGTSLKMYYTSQPQKMGARYSCQSVSRVRTCLNGELSNNPVECSQKDSGGCVDFWIDTLSDSDFSFVQCEN